MQWASSMATKLTSQRGEQREKAVAAFADEPFGRDIEEPVASLHAGPPTTAAFSIGRQRAVVERRRHAVAYQRVDLVLHQRDERRDNDGKSGLDDRGRLKAQRLSTASRQHDDRITTIDNRVHRLSLKRTERGVSPKTGNDLSQDGVVHCGVSFYGIIDRLPAVARSAKAGRSSLVSRGIIAEGARAWPIPTSMKRGKARSC